MALDGNGNLYIAESSRIRKVSVDTGVITTVAGKVTCCDYSGDGGPATTASLNYPSGVAVDGSGNLYIADSGNRRVRKVSADTGVITTVAGNGSYVYGGDIGDGGPATSASLSYPSGVAVDGSGNLYIADGNNYRIRKVSADTGVISTVAGNGSYVYGGDGGPATSAGVSASGVAVDGSGSLYIAGGNRIRKVSADTSVITTVAGNGSYGYSGDGGPATSASVSASGVAVDGSGNLYIADGNNYRVRKVSVGTGVITTVAGNGTSGFGGDGGPATSASVYSPLGVAVDGSANLYIAESDRIRKVTADTGLITTVAGNGSCCYESGDGGPATSTNLFNLRGVAVDGSGNIFIAENRVCSHTICHGSNRIRKVSADTGLISTVAGDDSYSYDGDGGPATSANLSGPSGVAVDGSGNIYILDGNRIRKVSAETGVITTVAGNDTYGYSGDDGPATSASLNYPAGVAMDGSGNLYIADSSSQRIRKVSAQTGIITTVAGEGGYGFRGDNGPAVSARLANPSGVAVDSSGDFYFVDSGNNRIRKVDHRISTTTFLTSNADPTTTQHLALTATITPVDATGSVQFFDGSTTLGSVALSGGTATLSDLSLTVGAHSLVAVYSGDTNYAMSTSPAMLQAVSSQEMSTMTLTSDGQPTHRTAGHVLSQPPQSACGIDDARQRFVFPD